MNFSENYYVKMSKATIYFKAYAHTFSYFLKTARRSHILSYRKCVDTNGLHFQNWRTVSQTRPAKDRKCLKTGERDV